jgi:hypothetical protein
MPSGRRLRRRVRLVFAQGERQGADIVAVEQALA